MNKADILIVGGGPAGVVAAQTAKRNYPDKQIVLVKKETKSIIPCGIPYVFRRLDSVDQDIMSDQGLVNNGVRVVIGEVIKIKSKEKLVILENQKQFQYEKLILALGSWPQQLPLSGANKEGVWLIKKDYNYLKKLRQAVLAAKNIVIVGGGFIGVELAEELSGLEGVAVSIVEMAPYCLAANFSQEFSRAAEKQLLNKGVNIHTNSQVESIDGQKQVEYVTLKNGKKIAADLVILSAGAKPNIGLAQEAGLKIEEGGILVDEYLRTSVPDIFAIGDCAQTKDFITGKNTAIMLASVAASEARIAASNLYELRLLKESKGTIGAFSTFIDGLALAAAGITEARAQAEKIDYITGEAEAPNCHPATLPGAKKIKVKLIFSQSSENLLLGGELMGPKNVGEMVNILAMAIENKVSLFDFNTWQIATHPLLTSAPTVYPLINAAQNAIDKIRKR
jgi:NADPH-dependent 2,4-dienoyl-CoA reductase/sulfur reductase-like enzyme